MFKPFETTFAVHGDAVAGVQQEARADKVLTEVDVLKTNIADSRWIMADLMQEIMDNGYHQARGFNDFDEYVEKSSFDIGAREIRYIVKINKNSKSLGIDREKLKLVAISKLKEVFTLDPAQHKDHIVRLVEAAKDMTLDTVRDEVRAVKGLDSATEMCWMNLQVTREAKDNVCVPALERAKREYGDTVDSEGNPKDISDGKAAECIFADYMASPELMVHELEQALQREGEDGPVEA